jgi:hypothetical protein
VPPISIQEYAVCDPATQAERVRDDFGTIAVAFSASGGDGLIFHV